MTHTDQVQIVRESGEALQNVRSALIELYGLIGADPSQPQEVARRFSMNRNLTWKLARIINATDPFLSLKHLPGAQGLDLALKAFAHAGAPASAIGHVQDAIQAFGNVVLKYAEDRAQFELTLESMGLFLSEERSDNGRELAFRGNSMVWGVQAKTRLATAFIGPSTHSADSFDFAFVAGLIGLRRLRPTARWRLFRVQVRDDTGAMVTGANGPEELEPKPDGGIPLMLTQFCSPNLPSIERVPGPEGVEFVLPEGDVGNHAACDCFFGYIARNLAAHRDADNEHSSLAAPITLPVETLIFDIVMHKSLAGIEAYKTLVFGFPHGGADNPATQTIKNLLPITQEPVDLPGIPPALSTPSVPQYSKLAASIFERMGWRSTDFRGIRVQMAYPPMSTTVVLRRPLPNRP